MALALLSCLQHLPLSFAVTTFNFSAEEGLLRELLLITTAFYQLFPQLCSGSVGTAFHTSPAAATHAMGLCLCWGSYGLIWGFPHVFSLMLCEQHPSSAMFWDGNAA